MLEVIDLSVDIQGSEILRNLRFTVNAGELVCLVGRNGAGKTTTLRSIMGYLVPRAGTIRLNNVDLIGMPTLKRARLGIGYSPEDSEVFGELTVAENIALPTWARQTQKSANERIELAYGVFPGLRRYANRPGTHLSGGERKMLSIARALALDSSLFLLDEPFEGLSPTIVPGIRNSIHEIVRLGGTVLIAELELQHVPDYADRIYVIERGEIAFAGTIDQARRDGTVRRVIGDML